MNRFHILLALLLVSCGGSQKPGPNTGGSAAQTDSSIDTSSEQAFTTWSAARIAELRPAWKVAVQAEPLTLEVNMGEQRGLLGLGRMWDYCQGDVPDCEATVRSYLEQAVQSIEQLSQPPQLDPSQLVLAVRSKDAVDAYRQMAPDLIAEQIADDVFVVTMFDNPTSAKAATQRDLEGLGLDAKKARTRALENMREHLGTPEDHVKQLEEGQLGTFPQGFYTSSLLYPHEAWAKVAKRFGGKLLVSVPSNDMLLYADGRHPAAETVLTALTQRGFQEAERGVSPHVFKWTPKGWVAQ